MDDSGGGLVTFARFFGALRAHWVLVVACIALGAAFGALTALTSPTTYRSQADLYITVPDGDGTQELSQGGSYARQAVTSYIEIVHTAPVLQPVIDELGLDMTRAELAGAIGVSSRTGSQVMSISVVDTIPQRAADIVNAVSASFTTYVSDDLEAGADRLNIVQISPGLVASSPAGPSLWLWTLIGGAIGVVAGLSLTALRAIVDTRVRNGDDAATLAGAPLLAVIPAMSGKDRGPLVVRDAPSDRDAEAYRRLRTNIAFVGEADTSAFVIAAPADDLAAARVAANLAYAISDTGESVALIDGDLHTSPLTEMFQLGGHPGLAQVLDGSRRVSEVLRGVPGRPLFVLPSGETLESPSNLLDRDRMHDIVRSLGESVDHIVIAAPATLGRADASIIARVAGSMILVLESDVSTAAQVHATRTALSHSSGARVVGVVLDRHVGDDPSMVGAERAHRSR
ncbi:polysaccharide biosynthesis tyrosine autokinase [Microbacterium dauci]|uniref:Wzz/FepE/Etk N-terminal domain-containing protein n=1 Tax=Microbacterium dauci TaxID=3048008 RepID=A0ABT6ZEB1_9MICO|nr:polysaccharide biosynthesis tyrosine autokinase [Microbacterium sp. LX3-4]MDJ1114500.1 Wzz/FepE/Etk N-terminal domain-containing protein [Microbacterium sp. LX3-4]